MSRHVSPPERAPLNELSRWYGLPYQYLYGLVRGQQIPAENLGTPERAKWWVRTADLEAFLDGARRSS